VCSKYHGRFCVLPTSSKRHFASKQRRAVCSITQSLYILINAKWPQNFPSQVFRAKSHNMNSTWAGKTRLYSAAHPSQDMIKGAIIAVLEWNLKGKLKFRVQTIFLGPKMRERVKPHTAVSPLLPQSRLP
jgi:hypothetical protein